ncbi:hypothetical protein ASD83_06350 [Devosia sp. Root685]|nr:hypothetical protein ASD83_06350 [Devosia sp. Root685]
MICCATLIFTLKLAWTAARARPVTCTASGSTCMDTSPQKPAWLLLEIGVATGLLLLLCLAIGGLAFGQPPSAIIGNIHQIGCLALGRLGAP